MSVIADLSISPEEFELGRVLSVEKPARIVLETMVPIGGQAVPLLWVHEHDRDAFEQRVREHAAVERLREIETHEDSVLYSFRWKLDTDELFRMLVDNDAHLLDATGCAEQWEFELRFPSHDALSTFRDTCEEAAISIDIQRIYNPTKPDVGPFYGLSKPQREALTAAVSEGYYSIPRGISTKELAGQLDISDQATTERLRRAIITLTEHTLLADGNEG